MYFAILFKFEVYAAGHEWRVRDSGKKWHQFGNNDNNDNIQLHGEYAGIEEINIDQRKEIDNVLKECLPPHSIPLGRTHLIKHKIRVSPDAIPFRHKVRRMSPKLLNLALEEAKKWKTRTRKDIPKYRSEKR